MNGCIFFSVEVEIFYVIQAEEHISYLFFTSFQNKERRDAISKFRFIFLYN